MTGYHLTPTQAGAASIVATVISLCVLTVAIPIGTILVKLLGWPYAIIMIVIVAGSAFTGYLIRLLEATEIRDQNRV